MTEPFKRRTGGPLLLSEVPGCFLCGVKPDPFVMNYVRIGPNSPVFFVCPFCASKDGCENRVAEKFFALQRKELGR
jgi:hypothetical protein